MRPQAAPALDATDAIMDQIPPLPQPYSIVVFADEDKPRKLANLLQVHRLAITWSCGIRSVIASAISRAGAATGRVPNPFPGQPVPLSHPQVTAATNSDAHYSQAYT